MQRALLVRGDAHIAANLTPDLAADLMNTPNIGIDQRALAWVPVGRAENQS